MTNLGKVSMVQAFVVFYVIAYCVPYWLDLPMPLYYPLEHRWSFIRHEDGISQSWYGRVVWAFLVGGFGFCLLRILPDQLLKSSSTLFRIISGLMIVVLYAGLLYIALHELTDIF